MVWGEPKRTKEFEKRNRSLRSILPGVSFALRTLPQAEKSHRIRDSIAEDQYGFGVTTWYRRMKKPMCCIRLLVRGKRKTGFFCVFLAFGPELRNK